MQFWRDGPPFDQRGGISVFKNRKSNLNHCESRLRTVSSHSFQNNTENGEHGSHLLSPDGLGSSFPYHAALPKGLFLLLVLLLWFIWVSNKDALFAVSETINDFCHHITAGIYGFQTEHVARELYS